MKQWLLALGLCSYTSPDCRQREQLGPRLPRRHPGGDKEGERPPSQPSLRRGMSNRSSGPRGGGAGGKSFLGKSAGRLPVSARQIKPDLATSLPSTRVTLMCIKAPFSGTGLSRQAELFPVLPPLFVFLRRVQPSPRFDLWCAGRTSDIAHATKAQGIRVKPAIADSTHSSGTDTVRRQYRQGDYPLGTGGLVKSRISVTWH